MPVQRREHALATLPGIDVDALDPPPVAVAPVTPFAGEHQRAGGDPDRLAAGDRGIAHRDEVTRLVRVGEAGGDAVTHRRRIERLVFGFLRHRAGPLRQQGGIGRDRGADAQPGRCVRRRIWHHAATPQGVTAITPQPMRAPELPEGCEW